MIKLFQFAPAFGLPNASPFCMKLETYLRMAGLPFQLVNSGDVFKAPKRKLPYIDDGGTVVADSGFIIDYLKGRYGDPLDDALSPLQRALATAFQRLFEEDLYWAVVQTRWAEDAGWAKTRQAFFAAMPLPLRWFVPVLARRGLLAEMRGHGMGRHTAGGDPRHRLPRRDGDRGLSRRQAVHAGRTADFAGRVCPRVPGQLAVGARRVSDPAPRAGAPRIGGLLPAHEGPVLQLTGPDVRRSERQKEERAGMTGPPASDGVVPLDYCSATSTRRACAGSPLPVSCSGFFSSILSSATPAAFSASRTAKARCLASSSFMAGSPLASV